MKDQNISEEGIFQGIRGEIVVLAASLISFKILVDSSVNFLNDIFFIRNYEIGLQFFSILYFSVTTGICLIAIFTTGHLWNHSHKNDIPRTSSLSVGRLICIANIIVLSLSWILWFFGGLSVLFFLVSAGLVYLSCLIYSVFECVSYRHDWKRISSLNRIRINPSKEMQRLKLLGKARTQYLVVFFLVSLIGGAYIFRFYDQGKLSEYREGEIIKESWKDVRRADIREKAKIGHDKYDSLKKLDVSLKIFTEEMLVAEELGNKRWTDVKYLNLFDSIKHHLASNYDTTGLAYLLGSATSDDSLATDEVKSIIYKSKLRLERERLSLRHIIYQWSRVKQFIGVTLFLVFFCSLLNHWFYIYHLRLETNSDKFGISKTRLLRWSMYFIILLVIPFFKPVDEQEISIDKPFLPSGVTKAEKNKPIIISTDIDMGFSDLQFKELSNGIIRIESVLAEYKRSRENEVLKDSLKNESANQQLILIEKQLGQIKTLINDVNGLSGDDLKVLLDKINENAKKLENAAKIISLNSTAVKETGVPQKLKR